MPPLLGSERYGSEEAAHLGRVVVFDRSLEVLDGGREVALHRGKEQALLAYLLLHANELVPSDRLIDELWAERPPPTAAKILQNAVSQLRKALGDGRLLTRPPGYVLRVEPGELDLEQFDRLAERGRAGGDARLLREALELWRGEPLADLRDEPFVQRAALQLEEARLAVLEDRIDADLREGRDAELVPELERLIGKDPLRERPYAQLMLALYRAGRQGDALETYQRARATLSEELGLAPSEKLQELERKILNQDPGLRGRPPPGPLSRALTRQPCRRRLLALVAAVFVGAGALALGLVLASGGSRAPTVVPNSLVKIDPMTNKVVDVIRVGRQPVSVAVVGDSIWVVSDTDATVTRFDVKTGETSTIGELRRPTDIAAEDDRSVWVSTVTYQQVIRVNARTLQPEISVPLGHTAFLLAVGDGSLWVTEPPDSLGDPGTVAQINLRTAAIERRFPVGILPVGVAVGKRAVWVSNIGDATISRIALQDGSVERINVGLSPGPIAIGFGSVWLATGRTYDTVWRLNPATRHPDAVIKVGKSPFAIRTGSHAVWVTVREAGTLVRIDPRTNEVVKTIRLGYKPQGMAVGAGAVWVAVGQGNLRAPF